MASQLLGRTAKTGYAQFYEATTGDRDALIAFVPGYTNSGDILVEAMLGNLRSRAAVLVVNHPEDASFSIHGEAAWVTAGILAPGFRPKRLVVVGHSLGGPVALAIADELGDYGGLDMLQSGGIIAEAAPADSTDIRLPIKLWWAVRWPRFLNGPGVNVFNRLNGGYYLEPGTADHSRRNWHYMNRFPNPARRAQLRAMARMQRLVPGAYRGIPLVYLGSLIDPLVHANAAEKWRQAFGADDNCHEVFTATGWHAAHPEQPRLWNEGLLYPALDRLGLPVVAP